MLLLWAELFEEQKVEYQAHLHRMLQLHRAINNGNLQATWKLDSKIFAVKNLINVVGQPQMHIIPRKWARVA